MERPRNLAVMYGLESASSSALESLEDAALNWLLVVRSLES